MNENVNLHEPPRAAGFRMPAEWEPHAATWLAWPHHEEDWPGKFAPIPWVYAEITRALARHERVNLLVPEDSDCSDVNDCLERTGVEMGNVSLWRLSTERSWVRDSGPIFIVNDRDERAILDWRFNAWAKYDNWALDDQLPAFVAEQLKLPRWQPCSSDWRIVLEGGSIDVNGQGLMLTTEECLLSEVQQRNPPFTRADYERVFAEYLGVKKVLWLGQGIVGDDTHGHIDDLARFVNPRTIVTVVEDDPRDENYTRLQENRERLRSATDCDGRALEIVTLPMPRPVVFDGQRLPASYANFYIANGVVIVPTFNDPADRVALGTLTDLFPDREVVGIFSRDLVWGLGTLHCLSQQEPRG
jgi:agmatine deiminase